MQKFKNWYLLILIISPIIFELQRQTIPHFKALDLLFWLLGWLLTLEVILSDLWTKKGSHEFSSSVSTYVIMSKRNKTEYTVKSQGKTVQGNTNKHTGSRDCHSLSKS